MRTIQPFDANLAFTAISISLSSKTAGSEFKPLRLFPVARQVHYESLKEFQGQRRWRVETSPNDEHLGTQMSRHLSVALS